MVGILFVVFYLYALPWEAIGYGLVLCLAALLLVHAVGVYRYRRRHYRLEALCRRTEWEPGELPEAEDLLEEDFARLYAALSGAYRGRRPTRGCGRPRRRTTTPCGCIRSRRRLRR